MSFLSELISSAIVSILMVIVYPCTVIPSILEVICISSSQSFFTSFSIVFSILRNSVVSKTGISQVKSARFIGAILRFSTVSELMSLFGIKITVPLRSTRRV